MKVDGSGVGRQLFRSMGETFWSFKRWKIYHSICTKDRLEMVPKSDTSIYVLFVIVLFIIGRWFGNSISKTEALSDQNDSKVGAELSNQYLFALVGVVLLAWIGHWIAGDRWMFDIHVAQSNAGLIKSMIRSIPILITVCAGAAGVVSSAWPTIRELSGSDKSVGGRILRLVVLLIIGYVSATILWAFTSQTGTAGDISVVVFTLLLIFIIHLSLPTVWVHGRQPRPPTDNEQERINRVTTQLEIEYDDVVVCEVDGFTGAVWFLGNLGSPRMILYESFLDTATEQELAVALAEAHGRYESNVIEYVTAEIAIGVLYGVSISGLISSEPPTWIGFIAVIGVVGMAVQSTRRSYQVDAEIADRLGVESVIETYDRHGDVLFTSRSVPDRLAFLQPIPSAEHRIDRLKESDLPVAEDT